MQPTDPKVNTPLSPPKPEAVSKAEAKRLRKQQLNLRRRAEMEAYLATRKAQGW